MRWIVGIIGIPIFLAMAYAVTFVLTALIARLIDVLGRFASMPWRRGPAVQRPHDVHHSPVRFVLAVATMFFVVLWTPRVTEALDPITLVSRRLFYGALLIAFAEWLEGRSARPAAWVCYGGMAMYAFTLGANVVWHAPTQAAFDVFACIGFFMLAQRAARDDDCARRSSASDPAAGAP